MTKPDDKIGPYTLIRKLGRGAFGVVWLAEKRTVIATTKVALKFPNDEDVDLEAIKQEASLWIHASGHPNVLTFMDADVYDGQVVIVSEYAPDGSLSKWLETHGGKAPTIEAAVEMISGILSGLEHLHKRGIIHRDIKPDNILLQNESPRLADFGIARILKTTSKSTIATGTPAYMPPEAFDGKRNEQTDIWSLGVIFYQLLTGNLPFPQTDIPSLLMAIVTKDPIPLPASVPEPLRTLIGRTLAKDPAKRYESAGEMRRALRDALKAAEGVFRESRRGDPHIDIADLPTHVAEERRRRDADDEHRNAEMRRGREQGQRPERDHVNTPHGPRPGSSAQLAPPFTHQAPPRSKRLTWIILSVFLALLLGVFFLVRYNSAGTGSNFGESSQDMGQTPSYSPNNSNQATPSPSSSSQPTPTPSAQSTAVRLRLLFQGASNYSGGDGIEVTLQSSTQNFSQMTDSSGFVTFNDVPCGEEVEMNFRSDAEDRKLMRIKRYLSCGSSTIDLGIYSATFGERLGSTESDLDGEVLR